MHAALAILWPSCGAAELAGDGGHDFGRTARRCKVRGRAEGEVLALEDDRHGLKKRIRDDRAVGIFKACRLLVLQRTCSEVVLADGVGQRPKDICLVVQVLSDAKVAAALGEPVGHESHHAQEAAEQLRQKAQDQFKKQRA